MAGTKLKRSEVDRWTGNAITSVHIPEANKKAIEEMKARWAKEEAVKKKSQTKKK